MFASALRVGSGSNEGSELAGPIAGVEFFLRDLHLSAGGIFDIRGRAAGQFLLTYGGGCDLHTSIGVLVEPRLVSKFQVERGPIGHRSNFGPTHQSVKLIPRWSRSKISRVERFGSPALQLHRRLPEVPNAEQTPNESEGRPCR